MPHIHSAIDQVVSAFIVHNERVLLCDHKKLGRWLPIGGHVELTETFDEALFREIEEETRIDKSRLLVYQPKRRTKLGRAISLRKSEFAMNSKVLLTPAAVDIHDIPDYTPNGVVHRHQAMIYYLYAVNDWTQRSDEHNELRWFDRFELWESERMPPSVVEYAQDAIDTLSEYFYGNTISCPTWATAYD